MQLKIIDIISLVKSLVIRTFPAVGIEHIDRLIDLCGKNNGLAFAPFEDPDFVFGYFRYWPELVDAVECWHWQTLSGGDLTKGPVLHIGILITPTPGYRLTRELIDQLNPMAVSCHRYRQDGSMSFHFKHNYRFSGARVYASQH